MLFEVDHAQVASGHDITVKVTAEAGERIARVVTRLDGSTLGDNQMANLCTVYTRMFAGKGTYPANAHELLVVATDGHGVERESHTYWDDV